MPFKLKRALESFLALRGFSMPRKCELLRDPVFKDIYERCREFTLTPIERMHALYSGVQHVVRCRIPGDMVECGVWRGGSSMIMALALKHLGDTSRSIYLYDTFTGMSCPTDKDRNFADAPAASQWRRDQKNNFNLWCYSPLEAVQANLKDTGYPEDELRFVKGKVEETIPKAAPEKIALLRLDTDWYESTRHELEHLFPRLSQHGILLIDDLGEWQGAQAAVEEYLRQHQTRILLHRTDYSGRIAVKLQ